MVAVEVERRSRAHKHLPALTPKPLDQRRPALVIVQRERRGGWTPRQLSPRPLQSRQNQIPVDDDRLHHLWPHGRLARPDIDAPLLEPNLSLRARHNRSLDGRVLLVPPVDNERQRPVRVAHLNLHHTAKPVRLDKPQRLAPTRLPRTPRAPHVQPKAVIIAVAPQIMNAHHRRRHRRRQCRGRTRRRVHRARQRRRPLRTPCRALIRISCRVRGNKRLGHGQTPRAATQSDGRQRARASASAEDKSQEVGCPPP